MCHSAAVGRFFISLPAEFDDELISESSWYIRYVYDANNTLNLLINLYNIKFDLRTILLLIDLILSMSKTKSHLFYIMKNNKTIPYKKWVKQMFSMYILSLMHSITMWICFFALQYATRKNLQIILYSTTRGKWGRWMKLCL